MNYIYIVLKVLHMISEKFFEVEDENDLQRILSITKIFFNWEKGFGIFERNNQYSVYIDSYFALEAILDSIYYEFKKLEVDNNYRISIDAIRDFFHKISDEVELELDKNLIAQSRDKYKNRLKLKFVYEFSESDLERIQTLINELRQKIFKSKSFEEEHRDRLLKRLEKLQRELNKRVSNLDRFWGLVGEAGVVLGKFGDDAKPFVDRIREIAQIIWRTQSAAEELPAGTKIPMLGDNSENAEE